MKMQILYILVVVVTLAGCSCKKKPTDTPPPDNYDPRNVSRNSTVSANSFIAIDGNGAVSGKGHGSRAHVQIIGAGKSEAGSPGLGVVICKCDVGAACVIDSSAVYDEGVRGVAEG